MILKPAYTSRDVERSRRMARLVIEHFFGKRPKRLAHKAGGLSNAVFEVNHEEGDFIVRIAPDPTRLAVFLKEQWCVERARAAGVPVAEILEVGQGVITQPYMIQRREKGSAATWHPERQAILKELGRIARLINGIKTEGFGETFDWSSNRLSFNETFKGFMEQEFDWQGRLATLEKHRLLSPGQQKAVSAAIRKLIAGEHSAHLAHGDLRLKNVLVAEDGDITALIDWEHCASVTAPAWDLAIALHDLNTDGKQAFLDGYGLTRDEILDLAPAIKALNLLHYAPHVVRAAEAGEEAVIETYRVRLSGALDLYSL